ncbi:MAG: hypothetical protein ACK559_24780, partial [bacterium]
HEEASGRPRRDLQQRLPRLLRPDRHEPDAGHERPARVVGPPPPERLDGLQPEPARPRRRVEPPLADGEAGRHAVRHGQHHRSVLITGAQRPVKYFLPLPQPGIQPIRSSSMRDVPGCLPMRSASSPASK